MTRAPRPRFDLILITDPDLVDPVELVRSALSGVDAGRVAVQLRAKAWTATQRRVAARKLRELTRHAGSALIINGDPSLCAEVDADGVQLPADGPSIAEARSIVGSERSIGASCHTESELSRAVARGADFVLLAPWSDVPGKRPAIGPDAFAALIRDIQLPVYALGGIGLDAIAAAIGAGAHGVAVIRDAHRAGDRASWIRAACAAIDDARTPR